MIVSWAYQVVRREYEDYESFGYYVSEELAQKVVNQLLEGDENNKNNTFIVRIGIFDHPIELVKVYSFYYSQLSNDRFVLEVETNVSKAPQPEVQGWGSERGEDRAMVSTWGTSYNKVKNLFEKKMREA